MWVVDGCVCACITAFCVNVFECVHPRVCERVCVSVLVNRCDCVGVVMGVFLNQWSNILLSLKGYKYSFLDCYCDAEG